VTILLIDDNEIDLLINSKMIHLVHSNADVIKVQYLDAALQHLESLKLRNQIVDYMFIDIRMPIHNGFELLKLLKINYTKELEDTQIYMLSSSLDESDAKRVEQTPYICALLDKPLTVNVVAEVLKELD